MMMEFDPPVIAHRGVSSEAPENTMAAFTRAVQLGIQWVEFDVMLAACGTPIIIHDEHLDRTTRYHGGVGNYPYTFIQALDAGAWFNPSYAGEKIPTLDQLAEFLARTGLKANVEIKPLPGEDESTVKAALAVLQKYFPLNSEALLFSSFSNPALQFLRRYAPDCHLGLLMHEWIGDWRQQVEALQCESVHVNQRILSASRATEIKSSGQLLLSYTVNDLNRAQELFTWGVDAVFSDCPERIMRFGCL